MRKIPNSINKNSASNFSEGFELSSSYFLVLFFPFQEVYAMPFFHSFKMILCKTVSIILAPLSMLYFSCSFFFFFGGHSFTCG